MNYKRIGRALVCLLLVCCLIVNVSPVRADATGAGLAGMIGGVSAVSVPAVLVVGASAIALGVMADSVNPLVFESMVNSAVDTMSTASDYIKDGAVELLRTVDTLGNQAFYIAGEFLESLRQSFFDTGVLSSIDVPLVHSCSYFWDSKYLYPEFSSSSGLGRFCFVHFTSGSDYEYYGMVVVASKSGYVNFYSEDESLLFQSYCTSAGTLIHLKQFILFSGDDPTAFVFSGLPLLELGDLSNPNDAANIVAAMDFSNLGLSTPYDLSLGYIPTYSLDGTLVDDAFSEYMAKQIRFQESQNPDDPDGDESNYNWMVPLSLGAAGTVYAMTQAEQWFGSTPSDFSDYETVTDYTIVDTPTVGGFPGILTTPNIGAGTDDDTIPVVPPAIGGGTTTIDPVEGTLSDANAQTFLDSIGSFFSSWFDSILKWLEAIWELIKAGVITLAEAIAAIPAAIAEAITDVLVWAFVPSESYLDAEVTALCSEFPLADSCKNLITAFRDSLSGLGGEPPVIYIHLEDYEGSYNIGGTVPILDMRWYARYKPTVDTLLSSLLWIFFIWRVLVHAPSIISGVAGDVEAFNSGPSGGYFSADNPYRGQFERPARGRFESRRNRK